MAQGTLIVFEEVRKRIADGTHDMDTNVFKIALITTLPTAADATPALGDYTQVAGGNGYTTGGETLTTTWTEVGGTADFKSTGGTVTWTQNALGPTNIKAGLIYDSTTAVTGAAIAFIDFTTDGGTTAISLVDGDITWTPEGSNRIFSLA